VRASSCSHTRNTRQPDFRNVRFTSWSRFLLRENLRRQNARLFLGCVVCLGQPCQKQPSTKITVRDLGKMKSAFTRSSRREEALTDFGCWNEERGILE
jgi:hypothetical protein